MGKLSCPLSSILLDFISISKYLFFLLNFVFYNKYYYYKLKTNKQIIDLRTEYPHQTDCNDLINQTYPIVTRVVLRQQGDYLFLHISCYSILILGTYNYHQTVLFKWIDKENAFGLMNNIYTMRIYILTDNGVS